MGWRKEKRPLLAAKGFETRAASTFKGTVNLSTGGKLVDHVQELTGASTGTAVTNYGVTRITVASSTESATAAELVFKLNSPVAGVRKTLIIDGDAGSTKTIKVRTQTSAESFYGSTMNSLTVATGSTDTATYAELVGLSTSVWAITSLASTSVTLAGATA